MDIDEELLIRSVIFEDIKSTHERLIKHILNEPNAEMRWIPGFFPFTEPSYELEVFFNGKWVEMLGCGKIIRHSA